jgi:hypothetical protein
VKILHARILVTSQILSRFLADIVYKLVVCTCVVVEYSWLCFCAVLAMEQQKNLIYYQFLWNIRHKN